MITYKQYSDFFEALATKHPAIKHSASEKHFFEGDLSDLVGSIANRTIRYPVLMLITIDGRIAGSDHDNLLDDNNAGFLLLDRLGSPEDADRKKEIFNDTLTIGFDIIRRIQYLVDQCDPDAVKLFNEFDITNVRKKQWGPVWDMAYGWSFEFPIQGAFTHLYNPDLWT